MRPSPRSRRLNACIRRAAEPFPAVTLVDVNAFLTRPTDVQGPNHFDRQVYHRNATTVAEQSGVMGAAPAERADMAAA